MKTLVVGASGATGKLVVDQLINQGGEVVAIIRSQDALQDRQGLIKIVKQVHTVNIESFAKYLEGCDCVISCLGHNLSFKGILGKPRMLVRDTLSTICKAILLNKSQTRVKVILMNSSGCANKSNAEQTPLSQRLVVLLLRLILPPQHDNEAAADYLSKDIGANEGAIEWVIVRPDALVNQDKVTPFTVLPSPLRNAIFNAGTTSRINVASFMSSLVFDELIWQRWQGQMPVIYNTDALS